jgi:hypothetical protein
MPVRRYKAPQNHGDILSDPVWPIDPASVLRNRDLRRAILPEDLFASARQQVVDLSVKYLESRGEPVPENATSSGPLIVTGHQPELFHPGVWAKNFAANGIAKQVGGVALNLIADSDILKSTTIRVPNDEPHQNIFGYVQTIPFDEQGPELPYEHRDFVGFSDFQHLWTAVPESRVFRPRASIENLLLTPKLLHTGRNIGEHFSATRRIVERDWGCHNLELPVSWLCKTPAFAEFVAMIERNLPRFRTVYNQAILDYRQAHRVRSQNHPAPLLEANERPFWRMTPEGRQRPEREYLASELRLRALTLTLFARLFFADLFIHGIGGGMYDEVTDQIFRAFLKSEPPSYHVLTLTAHLPFPDMGDTFGKYHAVQQQIRSQRWNPQRHLKGEVPDWVKDVLKQLQALIESQPTTKKARKERFDKIRTMKFALRTVSENDSARAARNDVSLAHEVAQVLKRRDYAWILFPEHTLRPLMTQFLQLA